jgi:hypothetical protein
MSTVTIRNADRLQHVAVSRLTLYVAGRVHALLWPAQKALTDAIRGGADSDGMVGAAQAQAALATFEPKWRQFISGYTALLGKAREQAGSIAYTPWRLKHNRYFAAPVERLQETFVPSADDYSQMIEMWMRRRKMYKRNPPQKKARQPAWYLVLGAQKRHHRLFVMAQVCIHGSKDGVIL